MKYLQMLVLAIFLFSAGSATAQTKPAVTSYKVPKLYTQLGIYRDSVILNVAESENLLGKPIKIFDDNKGVYSVSSYQFLYRKKGVTEDEATGKVSPVTTVVANLFKTTPVPSSWLIHVLEQLKAGEELLFFDVIAKDEKGRVMYAPNFKITVKQL